LLIFRKGWGGEFSKKDKKRKGDRDNVLLKGQGRREQSKRRGEKKKDSIVAREEK